MKIKKSILLKAMKQCLPGVESGSAIIDGADTFIFGGKQLHSYNDSISVTVNLDIAEEINGVVKSNDFYNLVSKLKEEEIKITEKEGKWKISNGKTRAQITLRNSEIMKHVEELQSQETKFVKVPKGMQDGFKLCLIQSNPSPKEGIFVQDQLMVSTDTMRFNFNDLETKALSFYLPDNAIKELLKLPEIEKYCVTDEWVFFKTKENTIFVCRQKDMDDYPIDLILEKKEQFLKSKGDISNTLPDDLLEVIDRVSTLSKMVEDAQAIKITFEKESITLYSTREASGVISEKVQLKTPFKKDIDYSVWIDSTFLREAVKKVPDFYIKEIELKKGTEKTVAPILIFKSETYMQVVTTIQVNE